MNFYARALGTLALTVVVGVGVCSRAEAAPGPKESDLPDVIVKNDKDKTRIRCEVVREEPKEVVYKDVKGEKRTSWEGIDHIEYKGFPDELTAGEHALDRREFSKAAESADAVIAVCGSGREKDLFLGRARLLKAQALLGQKRYKEAATFADQALEVAGASKYAGPAYIAKVYALAYSASDDCPKASDEAVGKADTFGDEFLFDVKYATGYYYEHAKTPDYLKASANYTPVKSSTRREMQDRAELALARVKYARGERKVGRDAFESIVLKSDDPDTKGGAYLGLGLAYREDALAKNGEDKGTALREAVQYFLKGAILAPPFGTASTENHEANMREAARTYEMILETCPAVPTPATVKSVKDLQGRKYYMDEARKWYEDLYRQYPGGEDDAKIREKALDLGKKSKEIQETLEKLLEAPGGK